MLPRYTIGTGKSKKKPKKPNSVRERISQLMGASKTSQGNGKIGPPPQMLFSPRAPRTPTSPKVERYTRLHPDDRALLVEAIALLKRSIWGEPEIVSNEEEVVEEEQKMAAEPQEDDAPVLREDEVEEDQPA